VIAVIGKGQKQIPPFGRNDNSEESVAWDAACKYFRSWDEEGGVAALKAQSIAEIAVIAVIGKRPKADSSLRLE